MELAKMQSMVKHIFGGVMIAALLLVPVLPSYAAGGEAASAHVTDQALESQLQTLAATHHGHVSLYAVQLNTGRQVAVDADRPVPTASVIKLAILFEAMEQVRSGKAHWEEKLTLAPKEAVSGSGVLTFFDTPLTLTLKDVLTMMVIVSDNTATNLAIDRFGVDAINARIGWLGLKDTHLYKKVMKPATGPMPADQPKFGLGKTTAREMATIMERIGLCQLAGPGEAAEPQDMAICGVALTMLRNQFYRNTIPRYLEVLDTSEAGSGIASKTGSLNAVRNDVAIVAGKGGPMVLSIFTDGNQDQGWTADNQAEMMIARLAKEIVGAWSPAGIDGRLLVPGLGLTAR
ncbi:MAG: class A beta-lactamase-related serine hydrolase [Edaphobacter sp.]|uniref:serine hydrolase n=1 Tax=Edaphobacter sp. TaxID=1934404 RepID=UPI00238F1401|nr:serine hydrolase [Edaphobacter sp.]MDE1178329.1 class A beta-lactamase-related serine hydrolase [Edaphobacter sp.]